MKKDTNQKGERLFDIRSANEWIKEAKKLPRPQPLFGELWLENEISIMFGDAGLGKSVLAAQIADSLSTGLPLNPFETVPPGQRVIYIDLSMSKKQFEMRYSETPEDRHNTRQSRHYRFSSRFRRVEIDPCAPLPAGFRSLNQYISAGMSEVVKESRAKIVIIDSITHMKRSNDIVRDMLPMMRELYRLRNELGLSILVLAQTPKRDLSRPLVINDLHTAKLLCNFADNIFAIGQSRLEANGRYIKHIKPRSTGIFYGAARVPSFLLEKTAGYFLMFRYQSIMLESSHLAKTVDNREWHIIDKIKEMSGTMTTREIANRLSMSKTNVHRLLQMWIPPPPPNPYRFDSPVSIGRKLPEPQSTPSLLPIQSAPAAGTEGSGLTVEVHPAEIDQTPVFEATEDRLPAQEGAEQNDPLAGFTLEYNASGKEIFVEKHDELGIPQVWYQYTARRRLRRWERTPNGVYGSEPDFAPNDGCPESH